MTKSLQSCGRACLLDPALAAGGGIVVYGGFLGAALPERFVPGG